MQFKDAGLIEARALNWQKHYESCYYLLSLSHEMVFESSHIEVRVNEDRDTSLYVFEGSRRFHDALPATNQTYSAAPGVNLIVIA